MRKSLRTGPIEWSYLDSGTGDEVWLTFHGYGQKAEVMQRFMRWFRPEARVLSFDLPLHGETTVKKGKALHVGDLAELQGKALLQTGAKSCSVIGFSLGGRLVLKMVELVPAKLDRIVLVAPDGLKVNPLYWLVAHTLVGRWLFQLIIAFPQPLLALSRLLAQLRILDRKVHAFVSAQMSTKEKRQKVLDSWLMFRHINPALDQVSKKVWRYRLKLYLVFGKKDRVIHPRLAKRLSGQRCKTAQVILLDTGHDLMVRDVAMTLRDHIDP